MRNFLCVLFLFCMTSTNFLVSQGLSALTEIDDSNNTNQQIFLIVQNVYAATEQDFNNEIASFTDALLHIVGSLGEYSDQGAQDFNDRCDQELKKAIARIDTISTHALHNYYDGLQKIGIESSVGVTDPIAQKLQSEVNSLEGDMINEIRASVAILKSPDALPDLGQDIKIGVTSFQQLAQQEYAAAQAKAVKVPKTSWWKDLKSSGSQYLSIVKVDLEKESKQALADSVNQTLNELGQQATDAVSKTVAEVSKQASDQVVGYVTETAAQYSSYLTSSAMTFGSDLVGKQLTSTFQKYTADQLNNMFKAFPDYLKKEGLKAVGIDPHEDSMISGLKAIIRKQYPVKNIKRFDTLQVRQNTNLSTQEHNFVQNRMPKIKKALQDNFDVQTPLKIALCASGGGNRAMLVALGFYLGSQDTGLFDSYLYTMGVSGSTWTISAWSYLHATKNMTLEDFKNQLIHGQMNKSMLTAAGNSLPPMVDKQQQEIIATNSAKHFAYDQTVSSIDLYGGLIGNYTLMPVGKKRLNVTWSSIADIVEKGDIPLPIGAAVSYKNEQSTQETSEYYWYEIGPFEAGSEQVGSYVPTWAFGSKFNQGKPVKGYKGRAPEYPISYYQGVYGSAFTLSMNEVVDQGLTNPQFNMLGQKITLPLNTWIKTSLSQDVRDTRMYPATFHNYAAGLAMSPIAKAEQIRLYDGAMNINFPLPLAMRHARNVDVIVVCDAAVDLSSLKFAQLHAQRNGQKFPDMSSYTEKILASKPLTILNDPSSPNYDKDMVTILYCPFIKNNGYSQDFDPEQCQKAECNTFNFKYTPEQADHVVGLTRYNVNQIKNQMKNVFKALEKHKASK